MLLLLVGRFHALVRPQVEAFRRHAAAADVEAVVAVVTAADQAGTPRNPLPVAERRAMVEAALAGAGKPVHLAEASDVPEPGRWAAHLAGAVRSQIGLALEPARTRVLTSNPEIARLLGAAGYAIALEPLPGLTPTELVAAAAAGKPWQAEAADATREAWLARNVPARVAQIHAGRPVVAEGELTESRNFATYGAAMDAALRVKLEDLGPWIVPGCIVDLGCGTGALMEALSWQHRSSAFIGVDLSRELLARAEGLTYGAEDVRFARSDVATVGVPDGTATTAIFCSILHEVHSYSGYDRDRVRLALRNAARMLAPGGRLLVRDGVRPGREDDVHLACRDDDRSALGSTRDRFVRFAREFKGGPPRGGIPYRVEDGRFVCSLSDANEFLTKKDYLEHWDLEVKEEFGVFSLAGWRAEAAAAGLAVVHAAEYLSPWIERNRYRGHVELFRRAPHGALAPEPYPATHFVLAAEKTT